MSERTTPAVRHSIEDVPISDTSIVIHGTPTRRDLLGLLGAGAVVGLAGCTENIPGGGGGGDGGGTATIAMAEDPTKGRRQELYGGITPYTIPVLQTLTRAKPDLSEIVPGIATDWTTKNKTTWEFTLRDDVTFHNGVALNAEVAAQSLTGLLEQRAVGFADVDEKSFSAIDEYTLEITTTAPSPFLPGNLAHPVTALHYRGEETGEGPVGTGPFQTGKITPGEPITTTRFEDYYGNEPHFDELVFKGIPDDTTRTSTIRSGEVEVGLDLPTQGYDQLTKTEDVVVRTKEQPRTVLIPINIYKEPTDDRKLRLALQYAVDQKTIVQEIVSGIGTPAKGPFSPILEWSAHDSLPAYGPDMEKARTLVEESDYDGQKVSLILSGGSPSRKQIAEHLQQRFADIGVTVALRVMEPASYFDKFIGGNSNLVEVSFGSYSGATDYLIPVIFHSESFLNSTMYKKNGTGVVNLGKEFDQRINDATTTFDRQKRYEKYREIQHTIMEEAIIIPLYYKKYILATRSDIEGPMFHSIPRMIDWTTMKRT